MVDRRSIVIVGGGHNGLVAAAYLAQSGRSVTVLERLDHVGGAAVSADAFPGVDARLSRYSYLVSLLPRRILRDLGVDLQLLRRRYSSYTPEPGGSTGLLVDHADAAATSASFAAIGAAKDAEAWSSFYDGTARMARALFPTVCDPLLRRSEARRLVEDETSWASLIENPIGEVVEGTFANDLVRGVVLTDALIGTFAEAHDAALAANRCFLYHVIGNETGDWDVPVGGMGAVTSGLASAARRAGATIVTGAEVIAIAPDGEVRYVAGDQEHSIGAGTVLANVAPYTLERLVLAGGSSSSGPSPAGPVETAARPEGAQVKVNLMLSRLPRLRESSVDPAAAFGGTFHINELYSQLQTAFETASGGGIPNPLPAEIYCHSLTDPSILSPELRASGAQTLTVFGLHVPDRLITSGNNDAMRERLQAAVLSSLDSVLAEPIDDVLMFDANGAPCVETKTTLDIENALGMPGGNIFHGPLSWPFVEDDAPLSTPAERWGVATKWDRILLCGSGAQRGGAVSGLGGHNAAMAVLESQ
ncbi:phytoene dehydrogenase-like protein [Cryobacterium mesophilum]|uniref:NAD(P)/FAD-dependent oxidoreductase n=1 Tax=Terrimesophilobacter mesophilus TaxID=433647 RepID=A0A4R8VAK1_9MICO|nr:NAD(P)/FAD-dependent oxidoreductase [Terrimesophilobacter mesophilus]MBB5633202.1 phytoene dehydrogenase-like protein [Terrimesophilobacter mesophilus]TFB79949.1 NAD(P)/FAD-dependent oxidoreductase [Terrimesophilobacter mesophilus]